MGDKFEEFVSTEDGMVWRDIESAPTDGAEVILRKGSRVTAGSFQRWAETESHYDDAGNFVGNTVVDVGAGWCSYDGGFSDDDFPTHWMPLPGPPKDE